MPDFYGDVAGFKTYWTDRGQAVVITAFDNDEIASALLITSEWIDAAFMDQFGGLKVGGRDQVREWPRNGVMDIYGYSIGGPGVYPRELIAATYQGTIRQLQTPGIFFKDYTPGKYKSVVISGAVSVEYAVGSAYDFQTQMPAIGAVLYPILMGQGGFSALSGGSARA